MLVLLGIWRRAAFDPGGISADVEAEEVLLILRLVSADGFDACCFCKGMIASLNVMEGCRYDEMQRAWLNC